MNTKAALKAELKEIYDDPDFINGMVSIAHGQAAWERLLSFIKSAKQQGDVLTSDMVTAVALKIKDDYGDLKYGNTNNR